MFDLHGLRVDLTLVRAAVVVVDVVDQKVPLPVVGAVDADARVVHVRLVLVTDEDVRWAHPDHLCQRKRKECNDG